MNLKSFFQSKIPYRTTPRFWWGVVLPGVLLVFLIIFFGWKGTRDEQKKEEELKTTEPEKVWKERKFQILETQRDLSPALKSELADFSIPARTQTVSQKFDFTVSSVEELEKRIAESSEEKKILLKAGTYKINLKISDKKVVLFGEGTKTILEGEDAEKSLLEIFGGEVAINSLVLKNSRTGIVAEKARLKLANLSLENIFATAVFGADSHLEMDRLKVSECGTGIKLVSSDGWIKNSSLSQNQKTGLEILQKSNFIVEGNQISQNQSYGVLVDETSEAQISGNYIKENTGYNIRLQKEEKIFR